MAQRTIVQLTDDLDGKPISDGKGETVRFSLDRTDYEIDLADKNANAAGHLRLVRRRRPTCLRHPWRKRRPQPQRSGLRQRLPGLRPQGCPGLGRISGIEVSSRGGVSADLVAHFQEANA
jgi:hypothetical protein